MQLTDDHRCRLFGESSRPAVCVAFTAADEMCAHDRHQAIVWLTTLERATMP